MKDIERDVEKYFVTQVRAAGGWPIKLTSPGTAGLPDRLVLWDGGGTSFVEMKRPGGVLRPLQVRQMRKLTDRGFDVWVVSTKAEVDRFVGLRIAKARRHTLNDTKGDDAT